VHGGNGSPRSGHQRPEIGLEPAEVERAEAVELRVRGAVEVGAAGREQPVGDAEELNELIASSKLVLLSGAAHGLMAETPNAFNRAVLDYLATIDAPASAIAS